LRIAQLIGDAFERSRMYDLLLPPDLEHVRDNCNEPTRRNKISESLQLREDGPRSTGGAPTPSLQHRAAPGEMQAEEKKGWEAIKRRKCQMS
jgi:hypothetical protein